MEEPKTVKQIEFRRADQLVRIVRYEGNQFFIYNHRGKYIALFDDMEAIVAHVDEELIGKPSIFKLELEDYQEFRDDKKQAEMNKDMFNHIKSYVDSGGLGEGQQSSGLIL